MADEIKKIAFSMHKIDLEIIDRHNQVLANPGRSAALRHIIREWAASLPAVRAPRNEVAEDEKVILFDPQLDRE